MLDTDKIQGVYQAVRQAAQQDRALLEEARADVRLLALGRRVIFPRDANYVSLVASDGGHNRFEFNPFKLQVVRVVDSYGKELFFSVTPARVDLLELSEQQFKDGEPASPLGLLIRDLGVQDLTGLSPVLKRFPDSASWFQVYREICEWATLYELIAYKELASSTLVVHDGLLRSKMFTDTLFVDLYRRIREAIERHARDDRRDVFLVGLAKHSTALQHYQLAIALEGLFPGGDPFYAPVPEELQSKIYKWSEYVRSPEGAGEGEEPKFNMGSMFFVRFGTSTGDPVWTCDLLASQEGRAQEILGCLLADAKNGFPVSYYPKCLQQADHFAQVTDLDRDILEDAFLDGVKAAVGDDGSDSVDALRLATDVSARRYQ